METNNDFRPLRWAVLISESNGDFSTQPFDRTHLIQVIQIKRGVQRWYRRRSGSSEARTSTWTKAVTLMCCRTQRPALFLQLLTFTHPPAARDKGSDRHYADGPTHIQRTSNARRGPLMIPLWRGPFLQCLLKWLLLILLLCETQWSNSVISHSKTARFWTVIDRNSCRTSRNWNRRNFEDANAVLQGCFKTVEVLSERSHYSKRFLTGETWRGRHNRTHLTFSTETVIAWA